MEVNLITSKDLIQFKLDLLKEIEELLKRYAPEAPLPREKKYLRTKEVKILLGISETKLYELRRNKAIPYKKIQGTIIYDYDALVNYMESKSVQS